MSRLPVPGSDNGNWGDILNDYLLQSHRADGTLKPIPQTSITDLTIDLANKANLSHYHTANNITDSTVTGRALLTATDSASAQETLNLPSDYVSQQSLGVALNYASFSTDPQNAITPLIASVIQGGRLDLPEVSNNRIGETVITIPPGRWTISNPGGLLSGTSNDGRRVRGLVIQGAGRYTSEIVFAPDTAAWLIDNSDMVSRMTIRDLTFTGAGINANFMRSLSNGGPQGLVCERVVWRGVWTTGFELTGTDTNSEFVFNSCTVLGSWDRFLYCSNVQALNHNYISCDMEPNTGTLLDYQAGGNISIIGGSWIGAKEGGSGSGVFVRLGDQSGPATNRFLMIGVRIEYRTGSYKLIESSWTRGSITFRDVHDTGWQSDLTNEAAYRRAQFTSTQWPIILFSGCRLFGQHHYVSLGQNDAFQNKITYEDCMIQSYSVLTGFITTELDPSVSTRMGAVAAVSFVRCTSGSDLSAAKVLDQVVNGGSVRSSILKKHIVNLRTGFNNLPQSGSAAISLTVPVGAIVTEIRAWGRAGASSSTDPSWQYTLATSETTPTVLFQKGGIDTGGGQNLGFNLTTEPWFLCDTTARTQLQLTANANTGNSGSSCRFLVTYLA